MTVRGYSLTVDHNNGVDNTRHPNETDALGRLRTEQYRHGELAHLPDEELFTALAASDTYASIGFDVLDTDDMEPAT